MKKIDTPEVQELLAKAQDIYNRCNILEQKFIDAYVKRPNKAKAAEYAGCITTDNFGQCGWNIYNRSHVKECIQIFQEAATLTAKDVVKIVSDIAEANISDYYTKSVMVPFVPKITVSLQNYIILLHDRIEQQKEFYAYKFFNEEDTLRIISRMNLLEQEIIQCTIELRRNPAGTKVIDGQEVLVEEMQLDMKALIADKERARVKKVKLAKDGSLEVELYSAEAAHERLLRRAGEYEKDNTRVVKVVKPVIMDWGNPVDTNSPVTE